MFLQEVVHCKIQYNIHIQWYRDCFKQTRCTLYNEYGNKIHIHFLITNHSTLSHLLPGASTRRKNDVWALSPLNILLWEEPSPRAVEHGAHSSPRVSRQGSGGGGTAIIWNTPRKHCCKHSTIAKWSILKMWVCPSSLETCYPEYIISVLSRMGRKIQVLKVVLLFLSKKAHSLHIVEILVKWHDGENQIEDFWGHSKIRGAVRNPESFSLPREWINASSLYLWPCAFCPWPQRIWIVLKSSLLWAWQVYVQSMSSWSPEILTVGSLGAVSSYTLWVEIPPE